MIPSSLIITPFIHLTTQSPASHLTIPNLLHRPILANMNIQPLRLMIHSHHSIGLDNAVFLGEILLREGLSELAYVLEQSFP